MQHSSNDPRPAAPKVPWNKRKAIGARPPLQTKHVWSIRTKLQMDGKKRDLAMFNLAIDSKLRGCDVVHIKVEDIAPRGLTADRACVRQRKTGHPVKFELTEQTREAIDAYLKAQQKHLGDYLFESRNRPNPCISARQYSRLVSSWIACIGLDPRLLGNRHLLCQTAGAIHIHRHTPCGVVGEGEIVPFCEIDHSRLQDFDARLQHRKIVAGRLLEPFV